VVTVPAPGLVEAALLQVLQHALYGWEHILQSAVTVAVALIDACPAKAFDKGGRVAAHRDRSPSASN